MSKKIYFTLSILFLLLTLTFIYLINCTNDEKNIQTDINPIEINSIINEISLHYHSLSLYEEEFKNNHGNIDVQVINSEGLVLLDTTKSFLNGSKIDVFELMNGANKEGKLIYNLFVENITGIIIISKPIVIQNELQTVLYACYFVIVLIIGLIFLTIHSKILRPFSRLQNFARNVSKGELDYPLNFERDNIFGAFTFSFDQLRTALKESRAEEYLAKKSRKELIASISHDLKTPIASIKACNEMLKTNWATIDKDKYLGIIGKKADDVLALLNDLLNYTLTDLSRLNINCTECYSSLVLNEILEPICLEYKNKIVLVNNIPNCLIFTDKLRLSQVILNIINNSLKYAKESIIEISFEKDDSYIICSFKDYGKGVESKEIPFLFNQFYRGSNTNSINGSGLGLYIAKYIMDKSNGFITCENHDNGFLVKIGIMLI